MSAPYIDCLTGDRVVVPDHGRHHYSEAIVYLPGCYQVNDGERRIADRRFSRMELGLPETGFVFVLGRAASAA